MNLLDELLRIIQSAQQPWWIYAAIVLVPLCILISMREFFCWFCKINKIVNRLEVISARLENMSSPLNTVNSKPQPAPRQTPPRPEPKKGTREFTLE